MQKFARGGRSHLAVACQKLGEHPLKSCQRSSCESCRAAKAAEAVRTVSELPKWGESPRMSPFNRAAVASPAQYGENVPHSRAKAVRAVATAPQHNQIHMHCAHAQSPAPMSSSHPSHPVAGSQPPKKTAPPAPVSNTRALSKGVYLLPANVPGFSAPKRGPA